MDFSKKVLSGLENKFKTGELDSSKRDTYFKRVQKELEMIEEIGFVEHLLFAEFVVRSIIKTGTLAKWTGCIIPSSLIAFSIDIMKEDPVEKGRVFELYINPERVSFPSLILKISKAGKFRLIAELFDEFSSFKNSEDIYFDVNNKKASSQFFLNGKVLSQMYGSPKDQEVHEDINLWLYDSQLFSFLEKNRNKIFKMPEEYYKNVSETKNKLIFHDQLMTFLSKHLNVSLEKADLIRRALGRLSHNATNVNEIFRDYSFLNDVKDKKNTEYVFLKLSEEIDQLRWL